MRGEKGEWDKNISEETITEHFSEFNQIISPHRFKTSIPAKHMTH